MRPKSLLKLWAAFEDEWNRYDPNWAPADEEAWNKRVSDLERDIEAAPAKRAADVVVKLRLLRNRIAENKGAEAGQSTDTRLIDAVIEWVERQDSDVD